MALNIQSQSAVRRKACRNRRCATFKSQGVADQMRFWRDPAKRAGTLRQRLGLIVKGKRISCPPQYGPPNNDDDPPHHDYEQSLLSALVLRTWHRSGQHPKAKRSGGKRVEKQPKNRPPPTPTGMKGGCSPQNNLSIANQIDAARIFARADFLNVAG